MNHRTIGYSLLSGSGIEIGALHNPAKVPPYCKVSYCDAMSAEDARGSFPELKEVPLVHVDHLVNLDLDGLKTFESNSQDFIILNHVIEHIANPIQVILECFRVLRGGGRLVLSAPDMRYTFDKNRALTSIDHLWSEYEQGVCDVTDEHYIDFIKGVHPEIMESDAYLESALKVVRDRREHVHVWTSESFQTFFTDLLHRTNTQAIPLMLCHSQEAAGEFYSVWQKCHGTNEIATKPMYPPNILDTTQFLASQSHQDNVQNQAIIAQIQSYEKKLGDTDFHLAQKDTHIRNIECLLQEEIAKNEIISKTSSKTIEEKEKSIAHRDNCIAERDVSIAMKDTHIINIESLLRTEQDKNKKLSSYIEKLHQSKTWKITKPLRWIARIVNS